MIGGKTVLAVVTARGGSKGIPRKNIVELGGRPLIAWTIDAALRSESIDRLVLSSEDPEIIEVAQEWGCEAPFVRPAELARDDTPGPEPVLHAISALPERYEYVVLLQPTSPFRTAEDIDGCIRACDDAEAPACVSVRLSHESPWWMYRIGTDRQLEPVMPGPLVQRRQDLPETFALNGAVYVARTDWLMEHRTFLAPGTIGYAMIPERSLDIDTQLDLAIASMLTDRLRS